MRVKYFNLGLGVVELVFGIYCVIYRLVLYQATALLLHVDDPDHIAEIFENVIQALVSVIWWN